MLKKLLLFAILAVVVITGGAYVYRNMILKSAIEESGTYVMGVETELGSVNLELGDRSSIEL